MSGLPDIGKSMSKSATADLDGGKSGIHNHRLWLWIPGSALRAAPE
jgi:hypothetical protein